MRVTLIQAAMLTAGATAGICLGGCRTSERDPQVFLSEPRPQVSEREYRMSPPDVIRIDSKRVKEVDGHQEIIRPDGKITLPLIGSIFVAGTTTDEAARRVERRYREFYGDADISVRIAKYRSQHIYVFGEVSRPGPYTYSGSNDVLDTLARAQPSRLADPGRVWLLRPRENDEPARLRIDVDEMIKTGDMTRNAVLEAGDVLYIPPNGFAATGLALQQLLLPLQPAAQVVQSPADIDDSARGQPYQPD